jgi:hypothetical protein
MLIIRLDHVFFPDKAVVSVAAMYEDGSVIEIATIDREGCTGKWTRLWHHSYRAMLKAARLDTHLRRRLKLVRPESIATRDCSTLKADAEPALALLGGSVSEAVGHHLAARAPLQRVIANRGGGA